MAEPAAGEETGDPIEPAGSWVEVAVPVPLPGPLTYSLPEGSLVGPGCRVRVPLGRRKLVGIVLARVDPRASEFKVRPIDEVLDLEPVLPKDLLDLAQFVADYYLTPIGEVVRAMLPGSLPPWGNRQVSLTDAGALTPPRDDLEASLLEILLAERRMRFAELRRRLPDPRLPATVERLRHQGRLAIEEPGGRGLRFVKAVELRPGDRERQLEACGRSAKGRAVVEYLAALGRPATLAEVTSEVGCGRGVIRRLQELELLREFSQPESRSLARHRLAESREEEFVLRPDQAASVAALTEALELGEYRSFLLTGMTGAGKTEVYLRAIARCLELGRSAILLVPEIALVPALASQVRRRFGSALAILHSNLSGSERLQEWERLRRGEARVVLGPRSALLAPVTDLGLLIVDEEHETAYKQDAAPRYNGRDLALLRARDHAAVALLVSATPSLESRHNVAVGKLAPLHLTARAGGASLPEGVLVDLRREPGVRRPGEVTFSETLRSEIDRALGAGDQVLLLRNRRGYAPVLLCRACGEDFRCEDCGLPLTLHRRLPRLTCHYCGHERPTPERCPQCDEEALEPVGAGTERVEERFSGLYPGVAVDVLDADAGRRVGGSAAVLERFRSGRTQVLIGTQMVAKGHHFPRVALSAILHADSYLGFPDFRAVERTYSLVTQMAGRAGRGERPGRVVIQTFHPDHYAIRAALAHDDRAFAEEEMRFRKLFQYPPFTRLIHLLVRHRDALRAEAGAAQLAEQIHASPLVAGVRISGPAPAPLERLKGYWRHQLVLRSPSGKRLRDLVRGVLERAPKDVELTVDVDPYDLM